MSERHGVLLNVMNEGDTIYPTDPAWSFPEIGLARIGHAPVLISQNRGWPMDFRHVNAFIAIAEELSLRKAGRRLGVSQPALSRQIQQLEQELGLTLFVRQ